jgi:peptidoglycan/LPS O-acetylase OafA/YrhL
MPRYSIEGCKAMAGLILVVFVVAVGYAIKRSQRRWRTALYTLMAVVGGLAAYAIVGYFAKLPGIAAGEIGLNIGLLCGALAALIHSRRGKPSPSF